MGVTTMKTHRYSTRGAILLLVAWLSFSGFVSGQVLGADPRSPRFVQPAGAPARLVIKRNPNLGFNVIVRLWIDGQPAGSIGYGHTFEGSLAPGRHVLPVRANPSPRPPLPCRALVDVRGGTPIELT